MINMPVKAEVNNLNLEPPIASQKLAKSLYGPEALFTSGGLMYTWRYVMAVVIFTILATLIYSNVFAFQTEASYYTVESCRREGTSGIMANGKRLTDDMLIAASWDYPFGTRLLIRNVATDKTVEVIVSDRGPAKRLYRAGRKIDLSGAAFDRIANRKSGVVQVEVMPIYVEDKSNVKKSI